MANLSSAGPTNLQASSSDASILSEVPDQENANVASNNDQVKHEIHREVQQSTIIESNNADMGNSNIILYEQYLTTNDVSVVPSCASSAPNTAYVLIDNNVHTPNELLEVEHFNLQLKYQNLKEHFGNKKPVTSSDDPSFDSLFVIGQLNEQIQSQGNTILELKEKIARLTMKNSDADPIFDPKALVSQNKDLTAKLNALHDLNERFRAENTKVKQHYKELYDSIKITRAKTIDHKNSLLTEIKNLKTRLKGKMPCVTIDVKTPKVSAFEK
ncbi:hypothetical protein Tco_1197237 [Tanacetum coccineum]